MLGIILVDKPQGLTSHDIVSRLRRQFQTRRVGHAGTLDPLATGLLVIAIGPATRFLQYLPLEPKEYVVTYKFGLSTNTYDADGETTEERDIPFNLKELITDSIPTFLGDQEQLPPMFSAVKKNGKPLYAYARKGEEVERPKRKIYISEYELLHLDEDTATFRIVCSGGTYIRTLGHDLGVKLGCGAHVTKLQRTKVGKFNLENATKWEASNVEALIPLSKALPPLPLITLNEAQAEKVQHGQEILSNSEIPTEKVGMLGPNGNVLGIGHVTGNKVQPECVLPKEVLAT